MNFFIRTIPINIGTIKAFFINIRTNQQNGSLLLQIKTIRPATCTAFP